MWSVRYRVSPDGVMKEEEEYTPNSKYHALQHYYAALNHHVAWIHGRGGVGVEQLSELCVVF